FDAPANLAGVPSTFVLGTSESGAIDVFLNGTLLGSTQLSPTGNRIEHLTPQIFPIPAGILRSQGNVLALKTHWHILGLDGLAGHLLLGSTVLNDSVIRGAAVRHTLHLLGLGAIFILAVLIGFLVAADWSAEKRRLYVITLFVLLFAAAIVIAG